MKTTALRHGLWTALLLLSAAGATAIPATYHVNMSVQMQLGNFNPGNGDLVRVAGTFTPTDWVTTTVLTQSISDTNIWEVTFDGDIAPGGFENHKFIIDVAGTLNWEAGGNRFFQVPATATNLPVVYFNDITNVNLPVIPVTFQINMGVQITLGNFSPATDFVYVAGDAINNWAAGASVLSQDGTDTNLWVGTFNITNNIGTPVNYKFIKNTFAGGLLWESDGVGPNGAQNRQFNLPASATNLPVVFYNNVTNASGLIGSDITFSLNTAVLHARGTFDPVSGSVTVAGDAINNWSAVANALTQTSSNVDLWYGTFTVSNTVGALVNYKFVLNGGATWEVDGVGATGTQNRQLAFPSTATTLGTPYFNNIGTLGTMSVAKGAGNMLDLSWTGGPGIRVQSASGLTGPWLDVDPDTHGQNTVSVTNDTAVKWFRLIGP